MGDAEYRVLATADAIAAERWMVIPMPVDAAGDGPADPGDTAHTLYQVWTVCNETVCTCHHEAVAERIAADHNRLLPEPS